MHIFCNFHSFEFFALVLALLSFSHSSFSCSSYNNKSHYNVHLVPSYFSPFFGKLPITCREIIIIIKVCQVCFCVSAITTRGTECKRSRSLKKFLSFFLHFSVSLFLIVLCRLPLSFYRAHTHTICMRLSAFCRNLKHSFESTNI